jgi:hypothetical protein
MRALVDAGSRTGCWVAFGLDHCYPLEADEVRGCWPNHRRGSYRSRTGNSGSLIVRKAYGPGRWRKLKGIATVCLPNGALRWVELHWYETHGIGSRRNGDQAERVQISLFCIR